ncbi:ATP-dependent RNA helicase DED1 [Sphaceloma murrayae]|uniref:RNA helicase n=1 Tax=Sphaceloma murrayae TaxID=2082308 RepID=A0A2K1QX47_9PEZI|nr:ATP-dependent RNA helicase DED1 [Sphaceloma murrayae]
MATANGREDIAERKADCEALADAVKDFTLSSPDEDLGEVDLELEAQLFGTHSGGAGESLAALELEVTVEGPIQINPIRSFSNAELHPVVLENIAKCNYATTTAIQAYTIPAVLAGHDVVAIAQTGSGKTAAYLAPIISELMGKVHQVGGPRVNTRATDYDPDRHRVRAEPLVVIVCPTRELALQIHDEARRLSYRSQLRTVCCYGGIPVKYNLQQLGKGCDILIGTPGRLVDMLSRENVLSLIRVKFTVIDEADEMLQDTDWEEALNKIMSGGDANEDFDHRYLMFSATFPKAARGLARQYLQEDYMRVRVGRAGSTHKNVTQQIIWVDRDAKQQAVFDLITVMEPARTLIFCNSIAAVERLDDYLFNNGLPTTFIHSGRSQYEREDNMRAFYSTKIPILVTTAVTARGIDFPDVKTVINYDLPSMEHGGIAEYVHRIGRTGRIGHTGKAISFYNDGDESIGEALVKLLLETEQEVPDFLSHFKPESGKLDFNDDTDDEGEESVDSFADGHGDTSGGASAAWGEAEEGDNNAATGWGGQDTNDAKTTSGWVIDEPANAQPVAAW